MPNRETPNAALFRSLVGGVEQRHKESHCEALSVKPVIREFLGAGVSQNIRATRDFRVTQSRSDRSVVAGREGSGHCLHGTILVGWREPS